MTFEIMTGHIFVYGEIGVDVTRTSIQDQIDRNASDYEIHISSPGGEVYEGYAIYGILSNLSKPTKVIIEGICASIATLIAQAGDKVVMTSPAEFMIHNPYANFTGDSDEFRDAAEQLDRIKNTIISVYRKRTGLTEQQLSEMMTSETWMTADEAKRQGFVDEVQEKLKAVAYIDKTKMKEEKDSLGDIIKNGLAELKALIIKEPEVKNMAMLTLENGAKIIVGTESEQPTAEEMVGAMVTLEDGTPLEDGVFKTAEGVEITVKTGKIESAVEVAATEEPTIEELKAKIAELEAQLSTQNAAVEAKDQELKAQAKTISKFSAKVKEVEEKYNAIKDNVLGDGTPPIDAPDKEFYTVIEDDPMAEDLRKVYKARGFEYK